MKDIFEVVAGLAIDGRPCFEKPFIYGGQLVACDQSILVLRTKCDGEAFVTPGNLPDIRSIIDLALQEPGELLSFTRPAPSDLGTCKYCNGSKVGPECDECYGTGEVECSECGQMKECSECDGEKRAPCPACSGRGWMALPTEIETLDVGIGSTIGLSNRYLGILENFNPEYYRCRETEKVVLRIAPDICGVLMTRRFD